MDRLINLAKKLYPINRSITGKGINLTLKIINPTWLQLRDQDNQIILSKLMNKNEEFSYRSNLNYSITSGNAGNILVLIDNNVKGRIGDVGEVVDSFVIDKNFKN